MKELFILILFVLAGLSCGKEDSSIHTEDTKTGLIVTSMDTNKDVYTRLRQCDTNFIKIGDDIPTFKIISEYKTEDSIWFFLKSLIIRDSTSNKLIQKINKYSAKSSISEEDEFANVIEYHFEFINFDDYLDLYLLKQGIRSSDGLYFLYDKNKAKFIYSRELSLLSDVRTDRKNKLLYTFFNGGGGYWSAGTYKLKDNMPYLIQEEKQSLLDANEEVEKYHYVRKVRNNRGELKIIEIFDTNVFLAPNYFKYIR